MASRSLLKSKLPFDVLLVPAVWGWKWSFWECFLPWTSVIVHITPAHVRRRGCERSPSSWALLIGEELQSVLLWGFPSSSEERTALEDAIQEHKEVSVEMLCWLWALWRKNWCLDRSPIVLTTRHWGNWLKAFLRVMWRKGMVRIKPRPGAAFAEQWGWWLCPVAVPLHCMAYHWWLDAWKTLT